MDSFTFTKTQELSYDLKLSWRSALADFPATVSISSIENMEVTVITSAPDYGDGDNIRNVGYWFHIHATDHPEH
jgi:predicted transcriptional regulator